jgi:hypothetical protein
MHWESKHKQLKLIKERQTNNTEHSRDISKRKIQKSITFLTTEIIAEEPV